LPTSTAEKATIMYPTPTLWFEIGTTIMIGTIFLWMKPEYALFLYALALGFPDLAYPLGDTINLRVEDVLIVLFLARTILWSPAPLSGSERKIIVWQAIFLALCLVSIAVETAQGNPPEGYDAAKMAGCAVILLVLPRLVESKRRLQFFVAGLMCGGVALVIQVHQRLSESSANNIANFQQMKSAATFDTWNPNTIGQAAVLLVFGAGLGGIIFSKTLANRILWPCFAMGFALLPVSVFVRGTSVSIAAGFVLFLLLVHRWKWVLLFALVCLCAISYLHSQNPQLMEDAATVNMATGEGFSHRFERWDMAFRAIQKDPFLGQGFGQEWIYLSLIGSEGRAHNAYLTVWLELGIGGLLLFLAVIFQFFRAGIFLCGNPRFQALGALILALAYSMSLDSLALNTLYWEKLPTIALSLAVAVIGMCEGNNQELAATEIRDLTYHPFAQHS
jgi:O-antigen ligase